MTKDDIDNLDMLDAAIAQSERLSDGPGAMDYIVAFALALAGATVIVLVVLRLLS